MDETGRDAAPLAIGNVLGRAFRVMAGNPGTVFAIAFLFGGVPQALFTWFTRYRSDSDIDVQFGMAALFLAYVLVFILSGALSQAALVRATGAYLEGRRAGIGECLRSGIGKALPLIGLSILMGLGQMLGFLCLVIPGIMLAVMWSVASPALVEEDIGVTDAFGRSRFLTKHSRWAVFFLLLIVIVISYLIALVAVVPAMMTGSAADPGGTVSPVAIVVGLITTTVSTALWSTVITSLYFALRERRDGPRSEQLADVFA